MRFEHGLPVFTMPLPSRKEKCQFTLKPITDTVGDLLNFIQDEDKGVDRVAVYSTGENVELLNRKCLLKSPVAQARDGKMVADSAFTRIVNAECSC